MKILAVCQYYYPEPFRLNDICEELVHRGHEVMVVTGEPNYPEGIIYQGYEHHKKADEVVNGVTIHRCPIIPRKKGLIYRFLNYYSFPFSAKRYIKKCRASDGKPFDVVLVNQLSPVMMARPAITYGKKFGVPVVMYCLDLWPVSMVAGGVGIHSLIYKLFHGVSGRIYRSMDQILITSRLFRDYLEERFGIEDEKISYLPQYAEAIFEKLPPKEPNEVTDLVFAGNIGTAQSVETILLAAEKLKEEPVHFHLVGGGADLERLQGLAKEKELSNVTFYDRRPLEEMPEFYTKADAMLVTLQADPVLSITLPGKVQSYMAAGKPIIGAVDGETAEVIREAKCGFCGPAEDAEALVNSIMMFVQSSEREQMGQNAWAYYERHFQKRDFLDNLEKCLLETEIA